MGNIAVQNIKQIANNFCEASEKIICMFDANFHSSIKPTFSGILQYVDIWNIFFSVIFWFMCSKLLYKRA